MLENLRELYAYRALLFSLIQRDLAVRYRGSVLGFLWTFLNPVILMLVYYLVFNVYSRNNLPAYAYFMFVGLLPWLWFSSSVTAGTASIAERRDMLGKVQFPPQILPITVIGSALCNYILAMPIMIGLGLFSKVDFGWPALAFPVIVCAQLLLVSGIVYITSTFNVIYRDLQHLIVNVMTFIFFLTPILYASDQVPAKYRLYLVNLNPVAALMTSYQDILYFKRWPDWLSLAGVALTGLLLLIFGSRLMASRREGFAEAP